MFVGIKNEAQANGLTDKHLRYILEITGSKLREGGSKFFYAWRVRCTRQRVGRVGRACVTRASSPTSNPSPSARPGLFEPIFLSLSFIFSPYYWWNPVVRVEDNTFKPNPVSEGHVFKV